VYLVKWLNESIGKCLTGSLGTLGCLVDAVEAVLDNTGVFIEPYVSVISRRGRRLIRRSTNFSHRYCPSS
jgi:hypothetical protein